MVVVGCDISLNHGGFCFFDSKGGVFDWQFFHDVKKYEKAVSRHGVWTGMKKGKDETSHAYDMRRAHAYRGMFEQRILDSMQYNLRDMYFSVEGYAIHQGMNSTNRLLQIAELTGAIKDCIYSRHGKLRIHDPMTVKMFACHGHASKRDMREAAAKDGFEISDDLFKLDKKKDDLDGPGTDVVDAYWLGRMLVLELQLRSGEVVLSDLTSNQIKVFNRVTKSYPVNLLARPFIGDRND